MTSDNQNILLVPVYNPSDGWETDFLSGFKSFVSQMGTSFKVVLINDGSVRDIQNDIEYISGHLGSDFQYLSYLDNKGKGGALKYGLENVPGQNYMFTDVDFPYTAESMSAVWNALASEGGVVTGHRMSTYYGELTWTRKLLSRGLRILNKTIMGLPIDDTQCGLKAFDKEVGQIFLNCRTNRFLIDLELLLAVSRAKVKITPVNVHLRPDIDFTKFNSSVLFKELFNLVKLIIKYRII